ncbi:unnamed protein product [Trifolium pratense]|uniref:Uncharacterized protein n=1 Tax=Trifolium pratense TaxID=57577 RepID=A0ACB0LLZ1_TRIPR|nr:unnamed protein product [Trifolium pratense]
MAHTLKFVYIVIFFVSLFIIAVVGQTKCDTDYDCYKLDPSEPHGSLTCYGGYCISLIEVRLSSSIKVVVHGNKVEHYSLSIC